MKTTRQNIRLSLSLVGLTLFIFFVASWLDLVPSESEPRLQARIDFTESLAAQLSVVLEEDNVDIIPAMIKRVVSRHSQVQSVLLRRKDGEIISVQGEHPQQDLDFVSTPDLMKVPISKDGALWGALEVSYVPLDETYFWGLIDAKQFRLTLFIGLFGFIIYLLLVKKVLSHLDPYKVIPSRVKVAFNALSEGVVLVDEEERIVLSNNAFEDRVDYKNNQLMGKKLSSLSWSYPEQTNENSKILPWVESLEQGVAPGHVMLNIENSQGKRLTLIANSTPLHDAQNKIRGVLISFNDVTELEKINQELEGMTQFLRHEMHNALIGATSTIDLLEHRGNLNEADRQLLARAQKSHRVIKYLLESVREAKSIESSFKKEETRPLRLDKLVAETVNHYSEIYNQNPFEFKSDGAELTVFGQEERIIQMLDKLTTNAIDHSDAGTPIVFSCYSKDKHAIIEVVNQGQPLPKNKKALFELFASFRNITATEHNQGIGLYVVKLIAEAYGGTVEARDRRDVTGAEFIIRLPAV